MVEMTTGNELTGAKFLLRLQGGYFVLTGIWPLVHIPSFLQVTGDKAELWLVETVGCLMIAIGLALLTSRPRPLPPFPINLFRCRTRNDRHHTCGARCDPAGLSRRC